MSVIKNNLSDFKKATEAIEAFLSEFPKDDHTNLVLDYIFALILNGGEPENEE